MMDNSLIKEGQTFRSTYRRQWQGTLELRHLCDSVGFRSCMHDNNVHKSHTDTHTKVNVTHRLARVLHGCSGGYVIRASWSAAVFQLDRHTQARDPFSHQCVPSVPEPLL